MIPILREEIKHKAKHGQPMGRVKKRRKKTRECGRIGEDICRPRHGVCQENKENPKNLPPERGGDVHQSMGGGVGVGHTGGNNQEKGGRDQKSRSPV